MPIDIQAPDGSIARFPDGTPDAVIERAMAAQFGGPKPKLGAKATAKDVAKSGAGGAVGGAAGIVDALGAGPASVTGMLNIGGDIAGLFGAKNLSATLRGTADALSNPVSKLAQARVPIASYQPQTTPGKYARAVGEMLPNAALGPAGAARGMIPQIVARGAAVVVPGLMSEGAGQGAEALGASPGVASTARVAGAVAGGGVAGIRGRPTAPAVEERALRKLNAQAPQDAGLMIQRQGEYQRAGIMPSGVDLVDEAGRGVIGAAAGRMTPARTAAQEYAEATRNALPERMSTQARRHLSSDRRTPAEIGSDLATRRGAAADRAFGAVRNETLTLPEEGINALRTDHGRGAIREAASRERDPEVRAALNRLANDALDNPSTQITVGMADRISRVLFGRARAAVQSGDSDLAATLTGLGNSVRNPAMAAHPGYRQAITGFREQSNLMDAASRGEDFLARDTDAFRSDLEGTGPEGIALARATARRAVERASGENVSAAPGVARRLATAPEQRARTRALLDEPEAQAFEDAMQFEARRVGNANEIDPRSGSKTQRATQDALQTAGEATAVLAHAGHGNAVGAVLTGAKLWLKGQGMNNREAEALVNLMLDPTRSAAVVARLQARLGPARAQAFLQTVARVGAPALLTTAAAPEPEQ